MPSVIAETVSGVVPVLLIVTCSGAEELLVVTLPKSNDAGRTWMLVVLGGGGGGGGGTGVGAGAGLGALLPPPEQPAAPTTQAAKSKGTTDTRLMSFLTIAFPAGNSYLNPWTDDS